MSTILPIGTTVCQACRAPVAVVRRTVEVGCSGPTCLCLDHAPDPEDDDCPPSHTHAVPDVAWTIVDANGERHLCAVPA